MEKQSKEIKCKHCGYEWITASEKKFVSCPDCLQKTEVKEK